MFSVSSAADELAAIIAFLCLSERFRNYECLFFFFECE